MYRWITFLLAVYTLVLFNSPGLAQASRTLTGTVITKKNESAPNVKIIAGAFETTTDAQGNFSLKISENVTRLLVEGKNVVSKEFQFRPDQNHVLIQVEYTISPIHDSLVIEATALEPGIERRNEAIFKDTLFSRDDQVFQTLNAGINAGQHEGGGKSLEIRRFGFNLDHGGVNGGLKVLVDGVQQNQGTQGHGQGYLGQLKSMTPELVQDVSILNGPFSAEYGDFSGLGVVHIRLKESLAEQLTTRIQGGSFGTFRTFLGFSPKIKNADTIFAYEGSRTDGPFKNPLRYKRDNVTGNYVLHLNDKQTFGVKFNAGRNDFFSSGQLPLDEVAAGNLNRFGFLDPDNGGRIKTGVGSVYYKQEGASGSVFKVDGFVSRSLLDLFSNFTFFANDEKFGDEMKRDLQRYGPVVKAAGIKAE